MESKENYVQGCFNRCAASARASILGVTAMRIKNGYADQPTYIRIEPTENRKFELWIEQEGTMGYPCRHETLSYMTLEELLTLKDEVVQALERVKL